VQVAAASVVEPIWPKWPGGQYVPWHVAEAKPLLHVPARHEMQVPVPGVPYCPGEQSVPPSQLVAPGLVPWLVRPALQGRHTAAADELAPAMP
jgi:hypothetical protein